jgi:histidinol phosphatase-like enzyme (inositol monophosphatase family)
MLPMADRALVERILPRAEAFAREAGDLTLRYFGSTMHAEDKADGSPVTEADREAEGLLRTRIAAEFPTHGIVGEEQGSHQPDAEIRWTLDPIDGTRAFMRGVPLYAVLVGVSIRDRPAVGVVHLPALGDTVVAGTGLGCWWNGTRASVSTQGDLSRSLVLTTDVEEILRRPQGPGWRRLAGEAHTSRTWGDAYGHVLVATGRAEVMIDPVLNDWDAAPLLPILEEAGGRFTDLEGRHTVLGRSGISTNGFLHEQVLAALAG